MCGETAGLAQIEWLADQAIFSSSTAPILMWEYKDTPNTKYQVHHTKSQIQHCKYHKPNSKYKKLADQAIFSSSTAFAAKFMWTCRSTKYTMPNYEYSIANTTSQIANTRISNSKYFIPNSKYKYSYRLVIEQAIFSAIATAILIYSVNIIHTFESKHFLNKKQVWRDSLFFLLISFITLSSWPGEIEQN